MTVSACAGAGEPGSKFLPEDVQQYAGICDGVRALEDAQVMVRLAAVEERQKGWQAQLKAEQGTQRQLESDIHVTKDKVESYHKGLFTKLFRSEKEKARKLEKHAGLLTQEEEGLAACNQRVAALAAQIEQAEAQAAALGAQVGQLRSLQQRASAQLLQLFSSPAWQADAGYQGLQHACMRLDADVGQARATASAFGQAKPLLDRASQKLRSALNSVDWAARDGYQCIQDNVCRHTHQNHGGYSHHSSYSTSTSMGSMHLQSARRRVNKGAQAIMEARAFLPNMPHIQEALVSQCLAGSFMGGAASGMLIVSEAQSARSQISMMLSQVEACRSWVASSLAVAQQQLAQLEAAGAQRAAELDSFRRQQAQMAVASLQQQWQAEQPSAPPMPPTPSFVSGIAVFD